MDHWTEALAPTHFLDWTCATPAEDLALDEALLEEAEAGRLPPIVRVWEPKVLNVVLGASGRVDLETNLEACKADGIGILRRSSGGGTVLIGPGTLNLTVIVPIEISRAMRAVDEGQKETLGLLARALRRPGLDVELRGSGDLTLGDRKFSGSAQRRMKRFVLIHATILYRLDLGLIAGYLKQPSRQPDYRLGRSHAEFLTNVPLGRDEILSSIRQAWLVDSRCPGSVRPPVEVVDRLVREKFGDPNWICRF
ncbi:lipoate--protein ligase family protein [Isosphaeraceae bacterium EP7]